MSLEISSLCWDAADPVRLAAFWAEALRWDVGGGDRTVLVPNDGTRFDIRFVAAATPKVEQNRLHLDLTTTSEADQSATVERLLALGGSHCDVGQRGDEGHVVLADPEGNELCVIEPGNRFLATCGRLGSVTCNGSRDVGVFWSAALGWPLVWDEDEETAVRAPDGTGPFVTWGPPVLPKMAKNRLHLELAVVGAPGASVEDEVERLVSLGAQQVDGGGVLLDPDGNELSIVGGG